MRPEPDPHPDEYPDPAALREVHDLTGYVARHYVHKYGREAVPFLEKAAGIFEKQGDLHGRNRLLRLRDEILISEIKPDASPQRDT